MDAAVATALRHHERAASSIVEIDPGHGEPGMVPGPALSYAVASNVATVKSLVLSGFGVGDLPDFLLSAREARTLVRAAVPHDADCGLFLVTSAHWSGPTESGIEATILGWLRQALGTPRRLRGPPAGRR